MRGIIADELRKTFKEIPFLTVIIKMKKYLSNKKIIWMPEKEKGGSGCIEELGNTYPIVSSFPPPRH